MNTVTINTDASFSPSLKVGSFAYWIVSNQGKIMKSGVLKKNVHRPESAEFRCIINAFHSLIAAKWVNIEKIIVNTDCMNVIHLIKDNKKEIKRYGLKDWGAGLVRTYKKMLLDAGLHTVQVEFRHVKAHQSTATARQWVNNWCDQEAKKQMNQHIKKLKDEASKIS